MQREESLPCPLRFTLSCRSPDVITAAAFGKVTDHNESHSEYRCRARLLWERPLRRLFQIVILA